MDSTINLKHKIKINNSYESEPSSGSGSSLSEHHDDEDNLNLPFLLKPTLFNNNNTQRSLSNDSENCSKEAQLLPKTKSYHSSQESPFCGFGDSPYGSINKHLFGSQTDKITKLQQLPTLLQQRTDNKSSPGQLVFPKFYDTIVEENSCNAVDLQLAEKTAKQCNSFTHNSENSENAHTTITSMADLSFNGKFKTILEEPQTEMDEPSTSIIYRASLQRTHSAMLETSLNSKEVVDTSILRKYNNERSPDIFADSDEDEEAEEPNPNVESDCKVLTASSFISGINDKHEDNVNKTLSGGFVECSFADEQTLDCSATQSGVSDNARSLFLDNCRRERELLRRTRRCLGGVRPPPSVTIPQIDMFTTVTNLKSEILSFLSNDATQTVNTQDSGISHTTSLFKPTHTLTETKEMSWREILGVRQHGLSYNINKAAEHNEYLSLSVIERYIGAETATSYVNSPSSAKKRNTRLKLLMQSPGNRLSHLAKRRAVFSSANLATNSSKFNSSIGPQIIIDKKKIKNKRKATPKRMTPGSKKKNRKTPSSSARKRLFRCDLIKPGPSRETSKRALFQSPAKSLQQQQKPLPPKPQIKPEIANRVEKSKRALFLPDNQITSTVTSHSSTLHLESLLKRKRINVDDQDADELASQSSKLFRKNNDSLTPRALKIKSQSFCVGAGSSLSTSANITATGSSNDIGGLNATSSRLLIGGNSSQSNVKLTRAHSDMSAPANSLTENQRKKLLWAVSLALQDKKISAKHPNFKQYAAILARTVKRIFQEFYQKNATSNSETMLRLAKKYVFNVISGSNSDDIYLQAKAQVEDVKKQSCSRLSGYINAEEYEQLKVSQQSQVLSQSSLYRGRLSTSVQNIFLGENSIDSFGLSQFSQTSSAYCSENILSQQSSVHERLTEDATAHLLNSNSDSKSASKKLIIQPNAALQNSSSKSNLGGLALRENVDGDQRRSTQKNFTGKDQRNVSPYTGGGPSSGRKVQSQLINGLSGSGVKAKRQISFDS